MLPEAFKKRMKELLADEYYKFLSHFEDDEAVRGLRINTLLTEKEKFLSIPKEYNLTPIEYSDDGFILSDGEGIGNTPEHHAGMIYIQDPGAMSAMCALNLKEGAWVLDTCAAPGGKSAQAAVKTEKGGFLFSNEFVPKRAKITVGNFERLGISNAIVTSLDTHELGKMFSGIFDLVIVDAPCSGEGMFRKSEIAVSEWSEDNVAHSEQRQKQILCNVYNTVKPGGYLLYSTCTYSLEENESQVLSFLKEHEDFELCAVNAKLAACTRDGVKLNNKSGIDTTLMRRFYPHVSKGEGQFVALLKRKESIAIKQTILYKDTSKEPTKDEKAAIEKFIRENLKQTPRGKIRRVGENLVILTHGCPVPERSVFSSGVLLGTVEKGLLFPSHQFFKVFGELFIRQERLSFDDGRVHAYLRGEEIAAKEITGSGWCSLSYEGASLGGGKLSAGRIKNHYPKGLRIKN